MRAVLALTVALAVAAPAIAQTSLAPPTAGSKAAATPARQKQATDPTIDEAKTALGKTLKDPMSAQYQNVRSRSVTNLRGQPMRVVCGEVNAKNGYGGYIGFAPWIYLPDQRSAYMVGGVDDLIARDMIRNFCT